MKATLLIIMSLILISSVSALTHIEGEDLVINEAIEDNVYAAGNTITINDEIEGDLLAAANTITINAEIEDDTWLAANTITINEPVGSDVRVAANTITIDTIISGDLIAFGSTVTLTENAQIDGDTFIAGTVINMDGRLNGELTVYGERVTTRARVEEDASIEAAQLTIYETAKFTEDLNYTTNQEIKGIETLVSGLITYSEPKGPDIAKKLSDTAVFALMLIITGLVIGNMFLGSATKTIRAYKNVWRALLVGLVGLITIPIISVILMITIVGLPIGLIMLAMYIALFFLAYVASAAWIGSNFFHEDLFRGSLSVAIIIGGVILVIAMNLPVIGGLVSFLALVGGMGAILTSCRTKAKTAEKPAKTKKKAPAKHKNKT